MRPMILGPDELNGLHTLKQYAQDHPFDLDDRDLIIKELIPCAGDRPDHVIHLPVNIKLVYSIDTIEGYGLARHVSISIPVPRKGLNPFAINILIKELGFRGTMGDGELQSFYEEDHNCVHVLEFLLPDEQMLLYGK
jgi:hypothetical protein